MNIETVNNFIVNNFITITLLIILFLIFAFRKKITHIIMKKVPDNYLMVLALFIICLVLVYFGFDIYHRNLINGDQLSYMGAIIGGGITLFGVYATIDHTNHLRKEDQLRHDQERREDLAIQYKPIISIKSYHEKNFINQRNNLIHLLFKVSNIGRGEMYQCHIKASILINNEIAISSKKLNQKNNRYDILAPTQEEVYEILFKLPEHLKYKENYIDVSFNIDGFDLFNNKIKLLNKNKHLVINKNNKITRRVYAIKTNESEE